MKPQIISSKRVTFYSFHDVGQGGFGTPAGYPPFGTDEEALRSRQWFHEMQLALERLRRFPDKNGSIDEGQPDAAVMRWAIHLAQADLSAIGQGQWLSLQYEFEAILTFGLHSPFMQLRNIEGPTYGREPITKAQGWLARNLANVVDGNVLEYEAPKEQHYMVPAGASARRELALGDGNVWVHQIVTAFGECPAYFFHLMGAHIDAVRRCDRPDCRAIFLRDRRNQVFCSKKCMWRTTTRRGRKTPVERFDKPGRPPKKPTHRTPAKAKRKGSKHKHK